MFLRRMLLVSKVCPRTDRQPWMVITDKKWSGSRKFKAAYKKALSLEKKMSSELNALIEKLSSWVMIAHSHGLRDDALSDIITLEQVRELWVKSRDSIRTTLAALKNESATQLFYRSAPPVAIGRLSVMKRWLINLV